MSVAESHIAELRKQLAAERAESERLRKELAAWPGKAIQHALDARERERELIESRGGYYNSGAVERGCGDPNCEDCV